MERESGRPRGGSPATTDTTVARPATGKHSVCSICFKPIVWRSKQGLWVHTTVGIGINHLAVPR